MPLEDENPDFLYCSYCEPNSTIKRTYGSESSSAMTKHINRYHPLVIIEKATNKKQEIVCHNLPTVGYHYVQAQRTYTRSSG
jgi:hypothetical protein